MSYARKIEPLCEPFNEYWDKAQAIAAEADAEIAKLKADNASTQALADAAMEHAASMRGFLLDLRPDLRERSERDGWLFKHFYDRINDQLGMAP